MLKRFFLKLLFLIPGLAASQTLPPSEAKEAEAKMAEWLAHPMEFGVKPKSIKYLRSVRTKLAGHSTPIGVHLVEYEMPDGTYGRGFVNPVTWSFLGAVPYDKLTDIELVTAYCGWLWITPAISDGRASTTFEPTTLTALKTALARDKITDIVVVDKYKVGTSEFFEFRGRRGSFKVKGAGSADSKIVLKEESPQAFLPVVFTYLGMVMRGEI